MIRTHIKIFILSLLGLLMTTIVSSCNPSPDLLETIPADAAVVITLSPEQLDDDMDCTVVGGQMTASDIISAFFRYSAPDVRESIKTILSTKTIDRKLIAIYSYDEDFGADMLSLLKNSVYIITFKVVDGERLAADLHADHSEGIGKYVTYRIGSSSLVIKDRQGWLISGNSKNAVDAINRHLDIASGRSINSIKNVSDCLKKDHQLFNMLISIKNNDVTGWTYVSAKVDDNGHQLKFHASYFDIKGKKIDFDDNLKDINSELAKYMAPTDVFVIALGLQSDTDWNAAISYLSSIFPMKISQRTVMAAIVPYLKRIDGTVFAAAGPVSEKSTTTGTLTPEQVSFFIGVELKKSKIKDTMEEIGTLISSLGLPATRIDKDKFMWSAPGIPPITLQVVNGNCIAVTNRSIEQLGNESAKKALKRNSFAIWANIPEQLGRETYGGPGFYLNAGLADEFNATLSLNGSDTPILEQLAIMMSQEENAGAIVADIDNDGSILGKLQ